MKRKSRKKRPLNEKEREEMNKKKGTERKNPQIKMKEKQ